jgi:hypothetical protein
MKIEARRWKCDEVLLIFFAKSKTGAFLADFLEFICREF